MAQNLRRRFPISQTVVAVAGWGLYLYSVVRWVTWVHMPLLVFALILTLFPIIKLFRKSWDEVDAEVMRKLQPKEEEDLPVPPKRLARAMTTTEELVWQTHLHPIHLLGWDILMFLATAAALGSVNFITWRPGDLAVNWIVAGVIWLPMLVTFIVKVVEWQHDHVCLTNLRMLAVYGLFTTRQAMMPLGKVTDETLRIPWHSRLLFWMGFIRMEYGTLILESAGQDQALRELFPIPNAVQVNRLIVMRALSK